MSKLMIHGTEACGTFEDAKNIKLDEIDGMSAGNVQEGIEAINNSLSNYVGFVKNERIATIPYDSSNTTTYTATENCWIIGSINLKANAYYRLFVNGACAGIEGSAGASNQYSGIRVPLKKGQQVRIITSEQMHEFNVYAYKMVY